MTETPILNESAVNEIEAKAGDKWTVNTDTIRALCATVKHLRAEIAEFEQTDLVPRSRYDAANADWLEAREQVKQLAQRAQTEIGELQSKVDHLLAENGRLQEENKRLTL